MRLELDVPVAFQQSFISLGLMQAIDKRRLASPKGIIHPGELSQLRQNLVTRFSYFTYVELDSTPTEPTAPDEPVTIYPGMIFNHERQQVCVIDHWGCFCDYPLLYVAALVPELTETFPLDVDVSAHYRDLFSENYYVRAGDFFLLETEALQPRSGPGLNILPYGIVRRISRAMALKFGQLELLL